MIQRYGEVPQANLTYYPKDELLVAKKGNDVRLFIVLDGVCYQLGFLQTALVGDTDAATDHGLLTGLNDDDHPQYVLRSILTTKGDLFIRNASVVSRLAIGSNWDFLVPDSSATEGMSWITPVINRDEFILHNDEMVTV